MENRLCTGQSKIRSKTCSRQESQVLVWFGLLLMLQHCSTQAKCRAALGLNAYTRKTRQFTGAWHPSTETGLSSTQRPSTARGHQQSWTEPTPHLLPSISRLPPPCVQAPHGDVAFGGRSLDCNTPDHIIIPSWGVPNPLCFSRLGRAATRCSEGYSKVKQTPVKPQLALQAPAMRKGAQEENAHGAVCGCAPAQPCWHLP